MDNTHKSSADDTQAYFVCPNCYFSKKIEDTTLIYYNSSENVNQHNDPETTFELINSNVLWYTYKYVCPNKDCVSHTNPEKRVARTFYKNNSYNIQYICTACNIIF